MRRGGVGVAGEDKQAYTRSRVGHGLLVDLRLLERVAAHEHQRNLVCSSTLTRRIALKRGASVTLALHEPESHVAASAVVVECRHRLSELQEGGIIKAIMEGVSPRVFRLVTLPAPSDREQSQIHPAAHAAVPAVRSAARDDFRPS